ncbi:MAG: histone deacetylase [Bacteroidetes bacterium]|nr:histone deacetylase [Bacteroidota bacterium]
MKPIAAWCPEYVLNLPEKHPFPMIKYQMLHTQLMDDGILNASSFFRLDPVEIRHLTRVHQESYVRKWIQMELPDIAVRKTGFPQNAETIARELLITGGTVRALECAVHHGVAFNLAGGTHHAYPDFGAAYCLLNDVAVAAAYALNELHLKSVLIFDLDVHQGDGTAMHFKHNPRVFTCSVHSADIWPRVKTKSDLDVGLPAGTGGTDYLEQAEQALKTSLTASRPEVLFYIAGADVLETDRLGNLALTEEDCQLRDRMVFDVCGSAGIPLVVTMGGGYAKQVQQVVNVHKNTFREGLRLYRE